jgi:hypothetical protein
MAAANWASARFWGMFALVLWALPATGEAQSTSPSTPPRLASWTRGWIWPILPFNGVVEDRLRLEQIRDSTRSTAGFLLRSPSSLVNGGTADWKPQFAIVPPTVRAVDNSGAPYSGNDGALWAGRGLSVRTLVGIRAAWGPIRLVVVPEWTSSANRDYDAFEWVPKAPHLTPFANPWHSGPDWIDLPLRHGDQEFRRVDPGQSSLVVRAGRAEVGVATENEWWGPAIRNALILSDNAPGFPHAFVRTAAPIATRIGTFEARWLVGGLAESPYFDTDRENDLRSISLLAFTWQPKWERDLTLGLARAVFAPASGWDDVAGSFAQVFANVPPLDATKPGEREQLLSLFFRWVFPADGFEAYAEWARAEQPVSLRDLLLAPNHSQAYTLGLQWASREVTPWWSALRGRVRVRGEVSFLEQSATYRFRPIGTWYTSPRVVQGYTNRGQTIGAAIGPGGSSQYVGIDYLAGAWQVGVFGERTRSFEDAHSLDPGSGWCNHDVSIMPGAALAVRTPVGTLGASYSSGWRHNMYFLAREGGYTCPFIKGFDVRSNSLSITFAALSWW